MKNSAILTFIASLGILSPFSYIDIADTLTPIASAMSSLGILPRNSYNRFPISLESNNYNSPFPSPRQADRSAIILFLFILTVFSQQFYKQDDSYDVQYDLYRAQNLRQHSPHRLSYYDLLYIDNE